MLKNMLPKKIMSIGTRSLLIGAHQFIVHPICVYISWRKLYGKETSLPLAVACLVHDWGYIGKPNMDGIEGEQHIELGGRIMETLYGPSWGEFTRRHSRFYCRENNLLPSALCYADKAALFVLPKRVYIAMVKASGELDEYLELAFGKDTKYSGEGYNDYDAIKDRVVMTKKERIDLWYSTMKSTLDTLIAKDAFQDYILREIHYLIPYIPRKRIWRK